MCIQYQPSNAPTDNVFKYTLRSMGRSRAVEHLSHCADLHRKDFVNPTDWNVSLGGVSLSYIHLAHLRVTCLNSNLQVFAATQYSKWYVCCRRTLYVALAARRACCHSSRGQYSTRTLLGV